MILAKFLEFEKLMWLSTFKAGGFVIEALMIVVSMRILWAQWLAVDLIHARSYPFMYYFFVKNRLQLEAVMDRMEKLKESSPKELREVVDRDVKLKQTIVEYNVIRSSSVVPQIILLMLGLCGILYIRPLVILSLILCDLLVARIHHLIAISL